jgi:hypothetical protein
MEILSASCRIRLRFFELRPCFGLGPDPPKLSTSVGFSELILTASFELHVNFIFKTAKVECSYRIGIENTLK